MAKKATPRFADAETVRNLVFQTVGAAASPYLWDERGVFRYDKACEIAEAALVRLAELSPTPTSKVRKVQLLHAGHGEYYWHAKSGNGLVVFDGGEKLTHKKRLIEFAQGEWPHAPIEVFDVDNKLIETIDAVMA